MYGTDLLCLERLQCMSDIVNINIGQAGVRIANHFWNTLRTQHCIDQPQQQGRLTFFEEKSIGWESRSIFIDLDNREIDKLALQKHSHYNQKDLITSPATSRGLYAESSYLIYPQMSEEIMDRVRRRVEGCDILGGFVFMSALGGGTSSGIGSKVSEQIRQAYPDKIIQSFRLFPDLSTAHPLEVYNATHALSKETQNSDMTMLFDNAWAQRTVMREGLGKGIEAVNKWVASSIAESTIPYRFSGGLNTSQRKIATNLVLFPRMHFISFAHSPNLTSALKLDSISLSNYYSGGGKIFNLYAGVRDSLTSQQEIFTNIQSELGRHQAQIADWVGSPIHISMHDPVTRPSVTLMVSSFNMRQFFNQLGQRFTATFRRRGFLCWYRGVGLDEMEFTEIQSNINDLASEYTPYDYGGDQDDSYQSQQVE